MNFSSTHFINIFSSNVSSVFMYVLFLSSPHTFSHSVLDDDVVFAEDENDDDILLRAFICYYFTV